MSWDRILGQEKAKEQLARAFSEGRVAHAYCFWGSEGVGKEGLAIEFARLLNCQSPVDSPDGPRPCGQCHSCHNADTLQHGNISLVFPLPTGKPGDSGADDPIASLEADQITEIQEEIGRKASDPYHKIEITKASNIKIASIRRLKKDLSLSQNLRGRRCVLIFDAETMNTESANAFLKTLEEPHDNITIIMVSSRPEMLLQTIMSRCQQIRFNPLPDDLIIRYLTEKHNLAESEARLAATFGQGSLRRAISFTDEESKAMRQSVVDILRTSLKRSAFRLELMDSLAPVINSKDKAKADRLIQIMIIWFRDAIAVRNGIPEIINSDQADTISSFVNNFGKCDLDAVIRVLETASSRIWRNVQLNLLFASLFLSIREILLRK